MTRDMDFRRQKTTIRQVGLPSVTQKTPLESPRDDPSTSSGSQSRSKNWLLIVLLLGLVLAAGGIYWKFVSGEAAETLNNSGLSQQPNSSDVSPSEIKSTIWLYTAGAKSDSSNELLQKLRRLDYNAVDSGPSQFRYTKTQIWYTTGHLTDAQTVSALIGTESVTAQTTMGGSFDVLVYLAK